MLRTVPFLRQRLQAQWTTSAATKSDLTNRLKYSCLEGNLNGVSKQCNSVSEIRVSRYIQPPLRHRSVHHGAIATSIPNLGSASIRLCVFGFAAIGGRALHGARRGRRSVSGVQPEFHQRRVP